MFPEPVPAAVRALVFTALCLTVLVALVHYVGRHGWRAALARAGLTRHVVPVIIFIASYVAALFAAIMFFGEHLFAERVLAPLLAALVIVVAVAMSALAKARPTMRVILLTWAVLILAGYAYEGASYIRDDRAYSRIVVGPFYTDSGLMRVAARMPKRSTIYSNAGVAIIDRTKRLDVVNVQPLARRLTARSADIADIHAIIDTSCSVLLYWTHGGSEISALRLASLVPDAHRMFFPEGVALWSAHAEMPWTTAPECSIQPATRPTTS